MKRYYLFLVMLFVVNAIYAKKKPDPKDARIDSLTKVNVTLKTELDSVSKNLVVYYGLYTTIKEKVLHNDFDPANFSNIIDSLRASRDSSLSNSVSGARMNDSLAVVSSERNQLKLATEENIRRNELIQELKQLKTLVDDKILTFTEFEDLKKKLIEKW